MELFYTLLDFIYTIQNFVLGHLKDFFSLFIEESTASFFAVYFYLLFPILYLSRKIYDTTFFKMLFHFRMHLYTIVFSFIILFFTQDLSMEENTNFIILFITLTAFSGIMQVRSQIFIIKRGIDEF